MKRDIKTPSLSYRDAGVDIDAGEQLVANIKSFAKTTLRPEILSGIGGFGGLASISSKYKEPILVSSTDGVGTKLKLAFELQRHDTVGIDLVAMSVNDILVQGAEPLFFLDYFACSKLDVLTATHVMKGIALGCQQAGCALIGGETAEMPGMYHEGEYDLAGFAVGLVEKQQLITGKTIQSGNILLGLASSGIHSNGYSLVRHIMRATDTDYTAEFEEGQSFGEVLIRPTRIYVKPLLQLMETVSIKGIAHITGGGLVENIPRVLPDDLVAQIDGKSWESPKIFRWLQEKGNVEQHEMYRTFNCGIGMVIILTCEQVKDALALLTSYGETVFKIGVIRKRLGDEPQIQIA